MRSERLVVNCGTPTSSVSFSERKAGQWMISLCGRGCSRPRWDVGACVPDHSAAAAQGTDSHAARRAVKTKKKREAEERRKKVVEGITGASVGAETKTKSAGGAAAGSKRRRDEDARELSNAAIIPADLGAHVSMPTPLSHLPRRTPDTSSDRRTNGGDRGGSSTEAC